ncbi:carbamate kinase-like protein [Escherichia coli]|uniref:Carbamate kinase-like protein n=1 Tax=Escherichia coli TaxID=562 RepID=A0A376ZMK5_ECOLX|nr:carbamate kinase-like protein [Escherichia coli]
MKELVVVAIGGNSIIKDNASQSIEHQAEAVKARGRYGAGNAGFRLRHCADPR